PVRARRDRRTRAHAQTRATRTVHCPIRGTHWSGAPERMTMHRLRAITDAGTFAVEIDADGARARLRSETTTTRSEQPRDDEAFPLASIDSDTVGVIPDGDHRIPGARLAAPLRAHVVADGDTTWVFIDGETFTIEVEPAERAKTRRGSTGSEGLAAPM